MPTDFASTAHAPGEYRPAIVAPTYNNARTLQLVLDRIDRLNLGMDVIVINDGSTDATPEILAAWESLPRRRIITHPQNRGKAAALLTAFDQALQLGYSHAITIDTDLQLEPEQIPLLDAIARKHPQSLVLGCRDESKPDYPSKSRVGRRVSNLLVKWESGARVGDSQCGFRVYPLREIRQLPLRFGRYALETEVLARCAWAGLDLRQLSVNCAYEFPEGRVSHFRPWRDSFAAVGMHSLLMTRSLNPWPVKRLGHRETGTIWHRFVRWISPFRAWRAVRHDPLERKRFAVGLAAGVFIANLPLYGVQSASGLLTARWLRLPPLAVLAGTHISIPPIGPVLIVAGIVLGHLLLHGSIPNTDSFDPRIIGYSRLIRSVLLEWTLGGALFGIVLGILTYFISRLLMHSFAMPANAIKVAAQDTEATT